MKIVERLKSLGKPITVSSIELDRYASYSNFGELLGTTDGIKADKLNKTEYYTDVKYVGKVEFLMVNSALNIIGAFVEVGGNPDYSLVYVDFTKKEATTYNPTNEINKNELKDKHIYFEGKIKGFNSYHGDLDETILVPDIDLTKIQIGDFPITSLDLKDYTSSTQSAGARDTIGYLSDGFVGDTIDDDYVADFVGVQVLSEEEFKQYSTNPPTKYSSVIKVAEFDGIENGQHNTIYSMVK